MIQALLNNPAIAFFLGTLCGAAAVAFIAGATRCEGCCQKDRDAQ